jgi:ABC-type branched-subunit amino acid transport system ATPase component
MNYYWTEEEELAIMRGLNKLLNSPSATIVGQNIMFDTSFLTKKYGDLIAVNAISFKVYDGECFGFLGPNGAGKTTLINVLCGLMQPSSGSVKVAGHDVQKETTRLNPAQVQHLIHSHLNSICISLDGEKKGFQILGDFPSFLGKEEIPEFP